MHLRLAISLERIPRGHTRHSAAFAILPVGAERAVEDQCQEWRVRHPLDAPESFVIFPGRVFRYRRGDETRRAEAQTYGRQLAVPEPQLDWTVCAA
jgi:hypothetical protein